MCIACTPYGKLRNLRSARFVYGAKLSSISLKINLNQCIAQLSSCSDSNVQQTGLAQKDIPVVVLITMNLIATQDFHRVSSKTIGEIVNSCIDDLEIKVLTLKGDMFMHFLRESVFEACL